MVAVSPADRGLPLPVWHARSIAEKVGAEIALLSCVFDSHIAYALASGDTNAIAAQLGIINNERDELESVAQSLRDWGIKVSVKVCWRSPPYEGILHELKAWKADLLVLGAHRARQLMHTFLTDTDWQLIRLCPCPLLLVKDRDFEEYPSVLAAVDPLHRHAEPSGLDRAVLEVAMEIGEAFAAPLEAVSIYPDPADYPFASSVEVLPGVFYGTENMVELHRKAAAELVEEYGVTPERLHLLPGDPAQDIAEFVREKNVKLLVVGAVKRGQMAAAVLGSTAEALAGSVDCDVLFVKVPERG